MTRIRPTNPMVYRIPALVSLAAVGLLVAVLIAVAGSADEPGGQSAAPTIATEAPTTAAAPTTVAAAPDGAAASSEPTASGPPRFTDGAEASAAAEGLIAPYIESQYDVAVADVACSEPPEGAEGDQFVCYGLKPDELVIALRATIGPERLITLTLITNQAPPPTTTTEPPVASSTPA